MRFFFQIVLKLYRKYHLKITDNVHKDAKKLAVKLITFDDKLIPINVNLSLLRMIAS